MDSFGLNIWWRLNMLREPLREVDSLIGFCCLRPDDFVLMHPRS